MNTTRHLHSYLPPLFLFTVVGIVGCIVAGCQTNSTAAHRLPADYDRTFAVEVPTGDKVNFFKDDGTIENATRGTVQQQLMGLGYDYRGSGPVAFVLELNWMSTMDTGNFPGQTNPPQNTADISKRFITLTIEAKDPANGEVIWKSEPINPVLLKTFSRENAEAMATMALRNFPSYPAAAAR